jgi:hypothetical protein
VYGAERKKITRDCTLIRRLNITFVSETIGSHMFQAKINHKISKAGLVQLQHHMAGQTTHSACPLPVSRDPRCHFATSQLPMYKQMTGDAPYLLIVDKVSRVS